jgi:hypothetical protein
VKNYLHDENIILPVSSFVLVVLVSFCSVFVLVCLDLYPLKNNNSQWFDLFIVALERNFNGPVIITSTQGGSNIEEIAAENPDAIIRHPINIDIGLKDDDARSIAERLGFRNEALEEVCCDVH